MNVKTYRYVSVRPRNSFFDYRAARGAHLLDQLLPGWEELIDWKSLDLDSVTMCVLGQLGRRDKRIAATSTPFGRASNPFRVALRYVDWKVGWHISIGTYGFTSAGDNFAMRLAWRDQIEERRRRSGASKREQEEARKRAQKDLRILPPDEQQLAKLLDKSAYELVA